MKIDETDRKILNLLSKNARASLQEIGHHCFLTPASIHLRIKKLEERGIIRGSSIKVDYSLLGYHTLAFIGIYFERAGLYKEVSRQLTEIPEITECSFTTGSFSLLVKVYCRDNHHLMDILSRKIQAIDGIARTETFISLEQSIERELEV